MNKKILKEAIFVERIVELVKASLPISEFKKQLKYYHENDIAQSLEFLTRKERLYLYTAIDAQWLAEIISYIDNPSEYVEEFELNKLADAVNEMDSDDAAYFWKDIDENTRDKLRPLLDEEVKKDIRLIYSYDEDEIGSLITTNYICIKQNLTIRQAMHELVQQAGENDNIATIYVVDENEFFCGAIDLKDLIVARENVELSTLISYAYPYLLDDELISESIEKIKDYAEDSLPVLNSEKKIVGIITAQDVTEAVDDELGEDYAKLAGLLSEEDLNETTKESVKKRLPWLIVLLFLGMAVSTVVGVFESVVAILPIVVCFQSLILDMAGNVGTQSLAVTIRVLMDENLNGKDKMHLVYKEIKVGFCNGILLAILSLICLGIYITLFKGYSPADAVLIAACVGISLLVAIVISSLVGTLVPIVFNKFKIDPAVASGPLITTVNDLVAVVTYYGLAWILLIQIMQII